MIKRFRKKPVVIEAVQLSIDTIGVIREWMFANGYVSGSPSLGCLIINTLEGQMNASPGDYIIRGVHGEFYPCKPEIFEATYDPVTETEDTRTKKDLTIE